MSMSAELDAIVASSMPQRDKFQQLKSALQNAVAQQDVETLQAFVARVFRDDSLTLTQTRPLLDEFIQAVSTLPDSLHKHLAQYTLRELAPRAQSFETGFTALRVRLAGVLEKEERFGDAADALASIRWDGANADIDFKVDTLVKIARFYLLEGKAMEAEVFVNNASVLVGKHGSEDTKLQYQVCYAQILDSKHRFVDAAMRYYHLSQSDSGRFSKATPASAELMQWLTYATICAILAQAGPRRSRLLSLLYSDERARNLKLFPLLEAIHMERLVNAEQISEFSTMLQPHQRAKTADGSTVLEKAVLMHNLMAASKLYSNIRFQDLGVLLGVPTVVAERTAAKMIYERRIHGIIDQVEGVVIFDEDEGTTSSILKWNVQIEGVCHAVDECANAIVRSYPNFAE